MITGRWQTKVADVICISCIHSLLHWVSCIPACPFLWRDLFSNSVEGCAQQSKEKVNYYYQFLCSQVDFSTVCSRWLGDPSEGYQIIQRGLKKIIITQRHVLINKKVEKNQTPYFWLLIKTFCTIASRSNQWCMLKRKLSNPHVGEGTLGSTRHAIWLFSLKIKMF